MTAPCSTRPDPATVTPAPPWVKVLFMLSGGSDVALWLECARCLTNEVLAEHHGVPVEPLHLARHLDAFAAAHAGCAPWEGGR